MPKYYDDNFEQDWEPVILKKNVEDKKIVEDIPFCRKVINARQKSKLSQHEFAQALNMKLNILENIENGKQIPDKKLITRMNKILSFKIPYN